MTGTVCAGRSATGRLLMFTMLLHGGCTQSFRSASLERQIEAFKQTTQHLADLAARSDAVYRAEFEFDGSETEAYLRQSAGLRVPIRVRLGVFGNAKGDRPREETESTAHGGGDGAGRSADGFRELREPAVQPVADSGSGSRSSVGRPDADAAPRHGERAVPVLGAGGQ